MYSFLLYTALVVFVSGALLYIVGSTLGKIWGSDTLKDLFSLIFKITNTISLIMVCVIILSLFLVGFFPALNRFIRNLPTCYVRA